MSGRLNGYRTAGRNIYAHRAVMEKHLGRKLLPNEIVHHIDENKDNNNIENLTLTTRAEHIQIHGVKHAAVKPHEVADIRDSTESSSVLAKHYRISRSAIWRIRSGKSWKDQP